VFLSTNLSVSDSQNSVVKVGSAVSLEDSTLVKLEGKLVSLNGN
jgi:hypothetical protein